MFRTKVAPQLIALLIFLLAAVGDRVYGQTFGTELHNTLMPASGGMAGVSIARPQDLVSAINSNPASLTQFAGTQFHFGGAWAEPTFNLTQTGNIPVIGPPLIEPFSAKSTAPGVPAGNIGVTQDLSELGMPVTVGLGFVTTSGGFMDFRNIPQSNGTNSGSAIFNLPMTVGVSVTDKLSIGGGMSMGIAFFDGPFIRHSGMTPDYALRGTLGANYLLNDETTIGGYYQTEQSYRFDNAVTINLVPANFDVRMDLPQNLGFGIANTSLMDGKLLLGVDVLYKLWDEAALYSSVYNNQLVVQLGTQYSLGRYRLRSGYAWAENPMDQSPSSNIGGVIQPGGLAAVRYTDALLGITSQHRISGGIGVVDVLPGLDFDLMAGGMFRDSQQHGALTTSTISSYWVGLGMTWRFGRGSCCPTGAPDSWCSGS